MTFAALVVIDSQAFHIDGASAEVFGRWFAELIQRHYGGPAGTTLPAPEVRYIRVLPAAAVQR